MSKNSFEGNGQKIPFSEWMKTSTDLWGQMSQMWPGAFDSTDSSTSSDTDKKESENGEGWWESAMKSWSTVTSNFSNAEDISVFFNEENNKPQDFSKIVQKGWNDLVRIQQEWLKNAPNVNEFTGAGKTETMHQNILNTWTELYENEFRKFFTIPQLGLTREYQEKTILAFDKLNVFQTKTSEFMNFILVPMKQSFYAIQEELIEMSKEGNLPKNGKDYYKEWVTKLENYYNELYKTPEYTNAMGEALSAMEEFITVRNDLLQDMMKSLPIPSQKEMDELYKDIYQLKKRLQKLEKKHKAQK